jgi:hypothetical protein
MVNHSDSPYTSNPTDDFLLRPNNQPVKSIVSKTNEKYSKGLDITHRAFERFQYQCTALASPNRYRKRYEMRDLTDLREEDEKLSSVAISRQAFAGPLLSVIVGLGVVKKYLPPF